MIPTATVTAAMGERPLTEGRILDDSGQPDWQLCWLFLSGMDKMQVRPGTLGDATRALDGG